MSDDSSWTHVDNNPTLNTISNSLWHSSGKATHMRASYIYLDYLWDVVTSAIKTVNATQEDMSPHAYPPTVNLKMKIIITRLL